MHGWAVSGHGAPGRLAPVERETPVAGHGEVGVRVPACGVCRTGLHLADGHLVASAPLRIPGHEVAGEVVDSGPGASRFRRGDRVGIASLRSRCAPAVPAARVGRTSVATRSSPAGTPTVASPSTR